MHTLYTLHTSNIREIAEFDDFNFANLDTISLEILFYYTYLHIYIFISNEIKNLLPLLFSSKFLLFIYIYNISVYIYIYTNDIKDGNVMESISIFPFILFNFSSSFELLYFVSVFSDLRKFSFFLIFFIFVQVLSYQIREVLRSH